MSVVLYSTGCPKCAVLKQKLDSNSIQFIENRSVDKMLALGITQVPMLSIEGELFDFQQANEWVNQNSTKEALES